MFLIFGWRKKTTRYFGSRQTVCPICAREAMNFVRIIRWFTIFSIPIFPLWFEYVEICPLCEDGRFLSREVFFEKLRGKKEKKGAKKQKPEPVMKISGRRAFTKAQKVMLAATGNAGDADAADEPAVSGDEPADAAAHTAPEAPEAEAAAAADR